MKIEINQILIYLLIGNKTYQANVLVTVHISLEIPLEDKRVSLKQSIRCFFFLTQIKMLTHRKGLYF